MVDLSVELVVTEIRIYADEKGRCHIPKEYWSDVTYGPNIKVLAVALYSEGVMSNDRIAAFLNDAGDGGIGISAGSVYGFCRKFAGQAQTSVLHLEDVLLSHDVVATDATTVTVNGTQNYIRNFSAENTVVYHAMQKKTIPALKKLDFLKKYAGILVHDHEYPNLNKIQTFLTIACNERIFCWKGLDFVKALTYRNQQVIHPHFSIWE